MKRSRFGNAFLGVLLAVGLTIVWTHSSLAFIFGFSILRSIDFEADRITNWSPIVLKSGELCLQRTAEVGDGRASEVQFQTFNNEKFVPQDPEAAPVWSGSPSVQLDYSQGTGFGFGLRIRTSDLSLVSMLTGADHWFFVKPTLDSATGYFVGFEQPPTPNTYLIGYLGTRGFTRDKPPIEEQFLVAGAGPNHPVVLLGSRNNFTWGESIDVLEWQVDKQSRQARTSLWDASRRRLYDIDLSQRRVRLVRDFRKDIPIAVAMSQPGYSGLLSDAFDAGYSDLHAFEVPKPAPLPTGIIRFQDRVEFVDVDWNATATLPIPADFQRDDIIIARTSQGMVVSYDEYDRDSNGILRRTTRYCRVTSGEDTLHRQERTELTPRPQREFGRSEALLLVAEFLHRVPVSACVERWKHLKKPPTVFDDPHDSWTSVQRWISWSCISAGVLSAVICWYLLRRRGRSIAHSVEWLALSLLLGPPGLLTAIISVSRRSSAS